jgi:hypothetical protein
MGCERFDLGIKRDEAEMILREGQGAIEIEEAIKWLRHENAKGAHIYIRPAGVHGLSLIDDLSAAALERMKAEGFEPAVVVETSPNNFQAWLNHGRALDATASTRAAKARAMGKSARKNPHAVALGRLGGLVRSEAKRLANRENGRKGGLAKSRLKTLACRRNARLPRRRRRAKR